MNQNSPMGSAPITWFALRCYALITRLGLETKTLTTARLLMIILAVSIVGRIASAILQGDSVTVLPGISDQVSYDALARRVMTGYGFTFATGWWPATHAGEPTAHWSFLYTLYLAAVYTIFGSHPIVARIIQAVIVGILQPLLAFRIGHRVFGLHAGLVAAGLTASYGYFVYYGGALMTESFTIVAILWVLDVATSMTAAPAQAERVSGLRRPSVSQITKPWLFLGVALGTAILLRQLVAIFVPALFLWLIMVFERRRRTGDIDQVSFNRRQIVFGACMSLLVIVVFIAPWTVRNSYAFGRIVPLNTNAGFAFFWANHPIYGTDFVGILPDGTYENLIPPDLRHLNEAALDSELLKKGFGYVIDDIPRYVQLSLSRVREYFKFWPSVESGMLSNIVRVLSFGVSLPFIVYGLYLAAARSERYVVDGHVAAVVLLCVFAVIYTLIHLLSWALIRYRLPVDAILLIFASLAVIKTVGHLRGVFGRLSARPRV
jgi:4-amino-4-deoxy-L-arabinose transferase-like glycosyltransferase